MEITLLAIGKIKDSSLKALCDDYIGRIKRYRHQVKVVELKEARGKLSPLEVIADETSRLLEKAENVDRIIVLDRMGDQLDSRKLASRLQKIETSAATKVAFLIGGSHGLDLKKVCNLDSCISLSKLTLTHEHARLILLEQLYRANTIIHGEPYHK